MRRPALAPTWEVDRRMRSGPAPRRDSDGAGARLLRTRRTRQRTREAAGGASGAQTRPPGGASSVPQLPAALFGVSAGALAGQRRRVVTPESVRENLGVHDGNGARELVPVDQTGGRWGREDAVRVCDCGRVEACLLYTSPSPRDGLLSRM